MAVVPQIVEIIERSRKDGLGDFATARDIYHLLIDMDFVAEPALTKDHPETSKKAARNTAPTVKNQAGRLLLWMEARGSYGATDFEIEAAGFLTENAVRARRGGLANKFFIKKTGYDRKSPNDEDANVWVITGKGIAKNRQLWDGV